VNGYPVTVMSDPANDKKYDEIIASLYQQGSVEKPSDELNKKILNAARNKSDNVIRWPAKKIINTLLSSHSLAVAAVLVISISVILQIQFDHPEEIISPTAEQQFSHATSERKTPEMHADIQQDVTDTAPIMNSQPVEEVLPKPKSPVNTQKHSVRHSTALKEKALAKKQHKVSKQQREQERRQHIEAKRLSERKRLRQKSERQHDESQRPSTVINTLSADLSADPMTSEAVKFCAQLSHSKCLESTNCILDKVDSRLICRQPNNTCEKNFVQKDQSKEQCQIKSECEFINSDCHCDEHDCQCEDDLPPTCKPVIEYEDDTD